MKYSIPIFRPSLPHMSTLSSFFDEIHVSKIYSNNGPLLQRFEQKFSEYCGNKIGIVGQANGTLALQTAILAKAGFGNSSKNICLMPSFTFSATVSAAMASGYRIHFVDVDQETWMVDPDQLRKHPLIEQVGLIVVTGAFGAMPDIKAWHVFASDLNISVVIDGAACADAFLGGHIETTYGLPVSLSFHATKPFGIGEGGAVICDDPSQIEKVRACSNFGFDENRSATTIGTNSKMSEMNAAVGLCLLEEWNIRRTELMELVSAYHEKLVAFGQFKMERNWVTTYPHILAENAQQRAVIISQLEADNIAHRRWWGLGCRTQLAYQHFSSDALPVTEDITERMIGLPFFADMNEQEIDRVATAVIS